MNDDTGGLFIHKTKTRSQALAAAAAATPVTGEFILTPAHSSDNDDEKNQGGNSIAWK